MSLWCRRRGWAGLGLRSEALTPYEGCAFQPDCSLWESLLLLLWPWPDSHEQRQGSQSGVSGELRREEGAEFRWNGEGEGKLTAES